MSLASQEVTAIERLPEEWETRMQQYGQPPYRGRQIFRWIHQRRVIDPKEMTDLPLSLRSLLAEREDWGGWPSAVQGRRSEDGTTKLELRYADGRAVESVLIPQKVPEEQPKSGEESSPSGAITQCVSSQVGCAMGCVFCASGIAGLKRNLRASEIVSQVLYGKRAEPDRLRNVVFMGMGEPLHNYAALARTLRLLSHPDGLDLSRRRVTVSTSGLVPEIDRLGQDFDGQVQLAVSLHVPDDERRSELMPINRRYPLAELVAAMRRYPMPRRRRITIEYTLVANFNDSLADADRLVELLKGLRVKVNLIPLNPVPQSGEEGGLGLSVPSPQKVDEFQSRLLSKGLSTFVRRRKGDDIAAACGQLLLRGEKQKVKIRMRPIAVD